MKGWDKGTILLTGIPGCGKTKTGALLAGKIGIPFFDLDKLIVDASGFSISEIFDSYGEAHFRKLEVETLRDLLNEGGDKVLALGGGTLESGEVCRLIDRERHSLVFLRVDSPEAARRLESGGLVDRHPLLRGLRGMELVEKLRELHDRRGENYSKADIIVETDGMSAGEVAAAIFERL